MHPTARRTAWAARSGALDSTAESRLSLRFLSVRMPIPTHTDEIPPAPDLTPAIAELLDRWQQSFQDQATYSTRHWIVAYSPAAKSTIPIFDALSDRLLSSLAEYDPAALNCNPETSLAELLTALLAPTSPTTRQSPPCTISRTSSAAPPTGITPPISRSPAMETNFILRPSESAPSPTPSPKPSLPISSESPVRSSSTT